MPEIDRRWFWIWDAWCALQPSRPYVGAGMAGLIPMPWPWDVIEGYGRATGCGEGERQMLHDVLRKLEAVQIKHDREEAKRMAEARAS
jgi:hypothetical protein